jgi:hypothetical protein
MNKMTKKRTLNELRQVKEYGAGTAYTSSDILKTTEYPRTLSIEKIKSLVNTIPNDMELGEKVRTLFVTNPKRNTKEDTNIFGKISGDSYKYLIENYQTKKGEEFNSWYNGLTNEEKIFITSMFD